MKGVLFGRIVLVVGLLLTFISLVLGFGLMFNGGYDEWAQFFFMVIPLGFVITFAGLSTIVLLSPRGNNQ